MNLYPFQQVGVDWLAERRVGFLCDDMGLGKTIVASVAADRIGARRILIVCPAIAREMWARACPACQTIPRSIQVVRTGADARRLTGDVVIVSYALADKIKGTFDLLICDEAQNLKTPGAARTKAIYGRDRLITRVKRVWLLSGTLAPNHPGELWTHYRVPLKGKLNYWDFVSRYCTFKETSFGSQITGANRARTAELAAIFRPHMLQRRQRDVLPDLPPLRWGHVPVLPENVPPQPELSIQELAILGRLERDEAISVADQLHLTTLRRWTGIAKAPAVVELIKDERDKLVIFAVHREVIAHIAKAIGPVAAVINGDTPQAARQAIIDSFQNTDQPRVLILQINTAGTALTLHRANHVIFAETTWTPADVVQAAKRCHRIGQAHSVLARVISLAGSIDERIAGVITRKARELAELEAMISNKQEKIA